MDVNPYESPRFAYDEPLPPGEPVDEAREEAKLFLYTLTAMITVVAVGLIAGALG